MRMLGNGGRSTQLPVHTYFEHPASSGFGKGIQNRSPEEVVKDDQDPGRDHKPQRRGCGCAAASMVALAIATSLLGLA